MAENLNDQYLGFYFSKTFWAVDAIDLENGIPNNFFQLMKEVVFQHISQNFTFKICRDGQFLFQVKINDVFDENQFCEASRSKWAAHLNYANAALLIFESIFLKEKKIAFFTTEELTTNNAFVVNYQNGEWRSNNLVDPSARELLFVRHGLFPAKIHGFDIRFDPMFYRRIIIPESVFKNLVRVIDKFFNDEWLIKLLSELRKSISELKIINFDGAIINSWFVVESIINDKWSKWIDNCNDKNTSGDKKRVNSKRKDVLNGKDYPISTKINILELNDLLPFDLFEKLNEIRKNRNDIAHRNSGYKSNIKDARRAISTTNELIENHFQMNILLNLNVATAGY